MGDLGYACGTFSAASVTSGSIVTGLTRVKAFAVTDQTTAAVVVVDYTTTAGTLAISGVTSNDVGVWIAWGDK